MDGNSVSASTGNLTSFSVGVFADAPVSTSLSIQPGLYYTGKGGSISGSGATLKSKINYIQLPVNVVYNVPVSAGKFFFGAGPYAAVGVNGKNEIKGGGQSISEDIEFGDSANATYKRADFGATGLVGFTFTNGLLLKANYDLGLSNISADNTSGENIKNRVVGLSVGFTF
jgi:hypothetical protein